MNINRLFLFLIVLVVTSGVTPAQSVHSQILLPVEVEGKWGFIDTKGKPIIGPKFSYAGKFSNDLAPVRTRIAEKEQFGYINKNGEIVIPFQFEYAEAFSEGFAVVEVNGKYGYIDTSGKIVVEPVFDKAWNFSNGMGRILKYAKEIGSNLYGFVNGKGQMAIEPHYIYAADYKEELAGFAINTKKGLRMGFIDRQGKVAIQPKYSVVGNFSEDLALVTNDARSYLFEGSVLFDSEKSRNRGFFYINKKGEVIIKGKFQSASGFSEGLAAVELNNGWSFIDKNGAVAIRTNFSESAVLGDFCGGLASVNFDHGAKFIDKTGQIVIQTSYNWADDFSNGYARVKNIGKYGIESYGYIDQKGDFIWKPTN